MTKHEPPSQTPPPYPGYPVPVMYPPEESIDWRRYWGLLIGQRKLIAAVTLASTLIAIAVAFLMTPVYRAEVLLVPVAEDKAEDLRALAGQFSDLAALAGISLGASSKDKTAEYVAALKSRAMFLSFINDKKLMPILFANKWDQEKKRWRDESRPPTEWKAFELWDEDVRRVTHDRRTGLITLTINWEDPAVAARWANDLVAHVNTRLRAAAAEEADRSIEFLQKQVGQTNSVEVQQAIYRLIETQTKKKMIASTRGEYAFATIDPAVEPGKPQRPQRAALIVFGFVLGVLMGIGAAILRGRLPAK